MSIQAASLNTNFSLGNPHQFSSFFSFLLILSIIFVVLITVEYLAACCSD